MLYAKKRNGIMLKAGGEMKLEMPCGIDITKEECPLLLALCFSECECVEKPVPPFGDRDLKIQKKKE